MAKYIIKNTTWNSFAKIAQDEASKNHWVNNSVDLEVHSEISDADFELIKRGIKVFTENGTVRDDNIIPFNATLIDNPNSEVSFTEDEISSALTEHKNKLNTLINNSTNPPAIWTTNLNALKAIDITSLTYPISGYNWVDCLIKNDIQVPSSMEL